MPTIAEATAASREGLIYVEPTRPPLPPPELDLQPRGTLMLRCPLPPVSVTPDTLRSFYLGSKVPQFRALTPPQNTGSAANANGPVTAIVTGGSSSGTVTPSTNTPQTEKNVSITTPFLTPGQAFKGSLTISTYKALQLLSVSASGAARIELYGNSSTQNSDFSRAIDTAPGAGTAQNIITDLALDTAPFRWIFQNRIAGNADTPQQTLIYITVTNIGSFTAALTVSLNYVPTES